LAFITLDLDTWPRRDHFTLFRAVDFPYFSVTVEVDLTAWLATTRAAGRPVFPALVHELTAIANSLPPFRVRIRGEQVIQHDQLDCSFTVPWRDDLFNFCTVAFDPDVDVFLARCLPAIAASQAAECLTLDDAWRDDMVYLSCLPWFAFTSMTHAVDARSGDSFPRVAWGKMTEREGKTTVPMNFQVHHALLDGKHIAQFLALLASRSRVTTAD
jgi:chloramphenicol O-acetyltransferase type A